MKNDTTPYRGLFGFIVRRPRLILACALLLSLLSVVYTWQRMEFLTGRDDLMPKNTQFHRDYRAWRAEFGDMEEIVVVIESNDQEKAGRFGEELQARLQKRKDLVQEIFFPFDMPFFKKNGLLFMPLEDLQSLRDNLLLAKPVLKELAAAPSVQTLFTTLTNQMDGYLAAAPGTPGRDRELAGLSFMLTSLGRGIGAFAASGTAEFSLQEFFFRGRDGKESAIAKAGQMQIMTILPVKEQGSFVPAEQTISLIRTTLAELAKRPEFKGVTAGLTGVPVLEHEEMATSDRDIKIATALSLALTVVLLLVSFRGVLNVVAAMISLIVAICLSFGFATLAVGRLNILSMVFAVMLIGIGIEYGIQVVLRSQEELNSGSDELAAIAAGLNRNIWGIVMAAATVAAAFLTFVFTDFKGIAELGIIAGGGVVICVLVTFTVLPGLMARRLLFGHPRVVVALAILLCGASLYPLSRIGFDYNLMNLQAKGLESVNYAYKLMKSKENSGYFAVSIADSAADAAAKTARLEALPTVDHVVSLNSFIPDHQAEKIALLRGLRRDLADIRPVPYSEDLQLMALPEVFERFRNTVEKLKVTLDREKSPEAKPVGEFLKTLDAFFAKLEKNRSTNATGMLRDFQGGMLAELPDKLGLMMASLEPTGVTPADVPKELVDRFRGKHGKYLLQVAPKNEIFDREPLKAFLDDVRSVDPHATGEPVMVYESMTIMRDAYRGAFVYAFVAIVVILLVAFRSIRYAVIGLVPLVVGLLFMVSGMWLLGISFNSANIIVMPLVLGIAVDSGIYLINRYRREGESAEAVVTSSTGVGVILNTLTIMVSFGALMVAHHQGVFSIGAVMSLGMLACQVAFVIVLPAVLKLACGR
ncbi:MAG: MMPL family transporter [Geobacter sp.]|nr:MMPL family transporter [Geobacter sp.]